MKQTRTKPRSREEASRRLTAKMKKLNDPEFWACLAMARACLRGLQRLRQAPESHFAFAAIQKLLLDVYGTRQERRTLKRGGFQALLPKIDDNTQKGQYAPNDRTVNAQ